MNLRRIFIIALALGLSSAAASAQIGGKLKRPAATVVGTWEYKEPAGGVVLALTFNADGTGKLADEGFKYVVKDEKLTVVGGGETNVYNFVLKENTLTLSGGDLEKPTTFVRKGEVAVPPQPPPVPAADGIAGNWEIKTEQGPVTLALNADGSGKLKDQALTWVHKDGTLTLSSGGQTVAYKAVLAGNQLTLSGGDLPAAATFQRAGAAATPPPAVGARSAVEKALIGSWRSADGVIQIKDDGTVSSEGLSYKWKVEGDVIVLSSGEGSVRLPFKLDGDKLTITGADGKVQTLTRVAAGG